MSDEKKTKGRQQPKGERRPTVKLDKSPACPDGYPSDAWERASLGRKRAYLRAIKYTEKCKRGDA